MSTLLFEAVAFSVQKACSNCLALASTSPIQRAARSNVKKMLC